MRSRRSKYTALCLAAVGAALLLSLLHAQPEGAAAKPSFEIPFDQREMELYRMDIEPVIPESGIPTGVVIAYGHPVPPPYVVTAETGCVAINGVQVIPWLKTPEMLRRERHVLDSLAARDSTELAAEAGRLKAFAQAHATYDSAVVFLGSDRAAAVATSRLGSSPQVDSVRQSGAGAWVYWAGQAHPTLLSYLWPKEADTSALDPRLKVTLMEVAVKTAGRLRMDLLNGRVLVFAGGTQTGMQEATLLSIGGILSDSLLTDRERLQMIAGRIHGADWLIANYSAEEWKWVMERGR